MFNVGDMVIATEDIHTLDSCFAKGAKLRITGEIRSGNDRHYVVQDEFGEEIFDVPPCSLRLETENGQRQILQPLLGLSDKDYDYLFTNPAASKGKTELQLLREYIRGVQERTKG